MAIERNIIFIYPITTQLKELKELLEKDGDCVIYELDSISEYIQIIGIVEHSITFSSDIKKTEAYLKKCKKIITQKNNKNYLIQEKNVSPSLFVKYQRAGLDEVILDTVTVKSLSHKINMFFAPLEQAEKKIEEEKNKAVIGDMKLSKNSDKNIDRREEYNTNERQRVEKTIDVEDDLGAFGNSRKHSGLSDDFLLGSLGNTNLELKKNLTDNSSFESPFDEYKRKKMTQFQEIENDKKRKNYSFEPLMGELQQKQQNEIKADEKGNLKRRKMAKLEFPPQEVAKRKKSFEEHFHDLKKKKKQFTEVEKELSNRKELLNISLGELNKKKGTYFKEVEVEKKQKNKFEEVYVDLEKRKVELEQLEEEVRKKKKNFQEMEIDFEKKRKDFDDISLDYDRKRSLFEDAEALKKKKANAFREWEDFNKKRKKFEENLALSQVKRKKLEEEEDLTKKKGIDLELVDLNNKKGKKFEEVIFEKKQLEFDEIKLDLDKKRKTFEAVDSLDYRKSRFDEVQSDKKRKGSFNEIKLLKQKKNSGFEEIDREHSFLKEENLNIQEDLQLEDALYLSKEKEYGEQTLDYAQFRKEHQDGDIAKKLVAQERLKQKQLEALLEEPEYTFYENQSFGLEFLVIYNDFILKEKTILSDLYKFIHFALIKSFDGDISVYLVEGQTSELVGEIKWRCLYSGHRARGNLILKNDMNKHEALYMQDWLARPIPTWSDMTFQDDILEFIYPYFEEGVLLGCAVCHFYKSVHTHQDAAKVEILAVSLKGAILEESLGGQELND